MRIHVVRLIHDGLMLWSVPTRFWAQAPRPGEYPVRAIRRMLADSAALIDNRSDELATWTLERAIYRLASLRPEQAVRIEHAET